MGSLFIGLMSGTSLDGVDAVMVNFDSPGAEIRLKVAAHVHRPLAPALRAELLALNTPGDNELHRAALAANSLSVAYADAVSEALRQGGVAPPAVRAIGAHGQTVRHRPQEFDHGGYTVQLLSPALLAELTGVDVVADFRSRDVAAGGQGAPLVPAFHRALFGRAGEAVALLNLGGIANLTVLAASGATLGFDCGPANNLMDEWCLLNTGASCDDRGRWAASGEVLPSLLAAMLGEPYFALSPPKSTGRDLFNRRWLESALQGFGDARPEDVQATLAELTARTCSNDVQRHAAEARELLVCGGGAFNAHLMTRLTALLPGVHVQSTDAQGLPAMQVEAVAFAWLAREFLARRPANLPSVTGARGERLLGALYPAA